MALVHGEFGSREHPLLTAIRSLGFPRMKDGPWVAGGALRRIFGDLPPEGDIDIFLPLAQDGEVPPARKVEAALRARGDLRKRVDRGRGLKATQPEARPAITDYYLTLANDQQVKVQVIGNRAFATAEEVIDDFDFTVCMAVTDGWTWIADERFFADNAAKRLVIHNGEQRRKNGLRLLKYCAYGFHPEPGVFATIIGLNDPKITDRFDKTLHLNMSGGSDDY